MATIPEGYVELDLVGFTDKGDYNSGVTYVKNDLAHNNNKIYLSLQDDNTGNALPSSTETENTYWKVWLAGSADDLANITVKDTSDVTGSGSNSIVVAQTLIDAIASKVMNDLVAKSQIVNNLTTSTTGSVLDASRGKNLQDQITQLNSNIWAPAWQNEVSDCDEAVQNNKVYSAKGAALHRPMSNDTYFTVWAYTWDDNNTTQFASSYGSGLSLYARKRSIPGVWGDWVHIYPPE